MHNSCADILDTEWQTVKPLRPDGLRLILGTSDLSCQEMDGRIVLRWDARTLREQWRGLIGLMGLFGGLGFLAWMMLKGVVPPGQHATLAAACIGIPSATILGGIVLNAMKYRQFGDFPQLLVVDARTQEVCASVNPDAIGERAERLIVRTGWATHTKGVMHVAQCAIFLRGVGSPFPLFNVRIEPASPLPKVLEVFASAGVAVQQFQATPQRVDASALGAFSR